MSLQKLDSVPPGLTPQQAHLNLAALDRLPAALFLSKQHDALFGDATSRGSVVRDRDAARAR